MTSCSRDKSLLSCLIVTAKACFVCVLFDLAYFSSLYLYTISDGDVIGMCNIAIYGVYWFQQIVAWRLVFANRCAGTYISVCVCVCVRVSRCIAECSNGALISL